MLMKVKNIDSISESVSSKHYSQTGQKDEIRSLYIVLYSNKKKLAQQVTHLRFNISHYADITKESRNIKKSKWITDWEVRKKTKQKQN